MEEILWRSLTALGIALLGYGAYRLLLRLQLRRAGGELKGLEGGRPGVPAILYFTTPTCQPCKMLQRPALKALAEELGDGVRVVTVDASEQPELADYWGVLSVPTTFVIDSRGQPRTVNNGVAGKDKLLRQIAEAEGRSPRPRQEAIGHRKAVG